MTQEVVEKLAEQIFKTQQPYFGMLQTTDDSTRLFCFQRAKEILDMIDAAGFSLVEKEIGYADTTENPGYTPDKK